MKTAIPALLFFLLTTACGKIETQRSEIIWDEWGVPHIYAANEHDLFYAHGWVQMNNHANLILKLFVKSRGQSAEIFGPEALQHDQMIHALEFPTIAEQHRQAQTEAMKVNYEAFVRGMNDYASAHPESIADNMMSVLPITEQDVFLHQLYVMEAVFVGGGDLGKAVRYAERGSNAYAIAPSRSESGNSMLVQNPHLPWEDEFIWNEAHFVVGNHNVYGATLLGLPVLGIAFNENLGWTHTVNTIDNADSYELTLVDGGYLLDGKQVPFESREKTLKYKSADGALKDTVFTLLKAKHGPVVSKGKSKALAIRLAGMESAQVAEQWWYMAKAKNLQEFEQALQMMQLPYFNVVYADKGGNIFYLFNGLVPRRTEGDWNFWQGIVPGDRAALIWNEYHSYNQLPKVTNPPQGWLQNANDPPWSNTLPSVLNPADFPPYMAPIEMHFRPQRAARMMVEDEKISFDELMTYKLDNRMEMADRILDDLYQAIDQYGNDLAKEAKTVFENWDRKANPDSKGAYLFYYWARKLQPYNTDNFSIPFSLAKPLETPDGLADPERAVRLLENAAAEIKDNFGRLDVPWGEQVRLKYANYDLHANGADGAVGVFRVAWPNGFENGTFNIGGGDSYVGIVEFGDRVKAKVLLSYGNSTQDGSPHKGDQLELFAAQKFRDAYIYREQVDAHAVRTEILAGFSSQ